MQKSCPIIIRFHTRQKGQARFVTLLTDLVYKSSYCGVYEFVVFCVTCYDCRPKALSKSASFSTKQRFGQDTIKGGNCGLVQRKIKRERSLAAKILPVFLRMHPLPLPLPLPLQPIPDPDPDPRTRNRCLQLASSQASYCSFFGQQFSLFCLCLSACTYDLF